MMRDISIKVDQGERLNENEALWLFKHSNLTELGRLANRVNLRKNGKAVYYNINRHINPTNICALSCKFCAYSKKIGEEGGYAYEIDEMIQKAGEAVAQGATELHMVGGLHPRWNFQRYVDMIAAMHKAYPDVHLKAFTAVELDWMARKARKTISEVMCELRNAGLGSFPGGGAEIFHPEVRDKICDTKVSGDQWIDTHRTAHRLGLRSNCTMLYGHIETYEHRVDHMRRLRDLQDETGGFNVFIPLAFQPFQNEMGINRYTFGSDDLRTIAVARLFLDNFKHIKSYWVMLGQDTAQLALQFGANDLDGTVLEEKISRAAGGRAGMIMTRSNLESLIRRSNRIPVERTTLYHPVKEDEKAFLAPVNDDSMDDTTQDMLQSLETGETITPSNLWKIAMTAPLHSVASALDASGKKTSRELSLTESLTLSESDLVSADQAKDALRSLLTDATIKGISKEASSTAIILDLARTKQIPHIADILGALKSVHPNSPIIIHGVSWINQTAECLRCKPTELLSSLRNLGLEVLEESTQDSELLSVTTKWSLFGSAQSAEIAVIPTIVFKSLGNSPDWSAWADDATEIRSRLASNKLIFAISMRVAANSLIMPSEYLKALALTRMMLPMPCEIWTPVCDMPALSPQRGLGATTDQHPAMKLISTASSFGSAGLGFVCANALNLERVCEDIRASGGLPRLTSPRQTTLDLASGLLEALSRLPHTPPATALRF